MTQRIFYDRALTASELAAESERDTARFRISTASREALDARVLFRGIHALLAAGIPEIIVEHLLYWPPRIMAATLDRIAELDASGASLDAKVGEVAMVARYGEVAFGPIPRAAREVLAPPEEELDWEIGAAQ